MSFEPVFANPGVWRGPMGIDKPPLFSCFSGQLLYRVSFSARGISEMVLVSLRASNIDIGDIRHIYAPLNEVIRERIYLAAQSVVT
jgi:hypothetical protein